ncbi:MAG: polysaccharide deacetylase family protein, partial [Actinomycetota bacterium]
MQPRRLIRDGLIVAGYLSGLPALRRRRLVANDERPSRILCFHRIVDVDGFEAKLAFLRNHFLITSLDGSMDPPGNDDRPKIAITFDDGYRSWLELIPLLERFEIPATFFLCSGFLDCRTEEESLAFCSRNLGLRNGEETLGWIGARLLAENPLFALGGHTHTHRNVATLSHTEAISEIAEDKRLLESRLE